MSEPIVLLPQPQRLHPLEGTHRLQPDRFILLVGDGLLGTASVIQEALAAVGPRWEVTAARGSDPSRLGAVVQVDPTEIPRPEGYQLLIGPEQVRITAHNAAGAFYAAQTLRQIARQASGGQLPCLRVEDWPDFAHRGVMLDISRDKVPTMATLYALVDALSEWKLNQLQLYTEHTFAYRQHREIWKNASPMTGEEILALDAYCRERFVELVPNQNSFGHMERWLNHPDYIHLAEAPEGAEMPWGGRMEGPFSLCPLDPGSLQLLAGLYDELLPHFTSRQFNVGCDETFDLGKGRSKAECDARGVGRVYLDFLLKIHELAQRHARTMQFWGDIIMHHPELIPELPGGLIALEWGYEANHPFAADGQRFAAAGVPYYVCPGTSSWNTIAGRTENAMGNLLNAAENGLAHGAIGFLITDWGDNGHWQQLPISFLGYAYGAAVSWAVQPNRDLDLPAALNRHVFRDAAGVLGPLAYDLGNAYREPGVLTGNSSVLALLLLHPDAPADRGWLSSLTAEKLAQTEAYVAGVMERLNSAQPQRPDAELLLAEFRITGALLQHACHLGAARLAAEGGPIEAIPGEKRRALAEELEAILPEYRRRWQARNRPGGLNDSVGRLERLLARYRGA